MHQPSTPSQSPHFVPAGPAGHCSLGFPIPGGGGGNPGGGGGIGMIGMIGMPPPKL